MLFARDLCPTENPCPVLESSFTATEVQELLSLLQAPISPNSGSQGSNRLDYCSVDEERKRRRKLSNRESARRSRWRKKTYLENLTAQLTQLRTENRELKKGVGWVLRQCHVAWSDNERLRTEALALRARFSDLHRILVASSHDNQQMFW